MIKTGNLDKRAIAAGITITSLIRRLEKNGGHVALAEIMRAITEAERMEAKVEVRDSRTFTEAE